MTARRGRTATAAEAWPPEEGEREELAVLEGGRWARRWYWRRDLEASQRAAERMGHPVTVAGPGELRGYTPTGRWVEHPADPGKYGSGRVWTSRPDLVEHQADDQSHIQDRRVGRGVEVPAPRVPVDDALDGHQGRVADRGGAVRLGRGGDPVPVGSLLDGVTRPARVLVCGSREWVDVATIRGELAAAWTECATTAGPPVLVHGACPRGADRIADMLWRRWGGTVETHPARWETHSRGAGYRRNAVMVELGADRVVGFVIDASPGSTHMLGLAATAGLDVRVHHATSRAENRR